tara:strand:- start:9131 stop:9976 length:846 start_codon:yes stop_codon:yes gene_type:complete
MELQKQIEQYLLDSLEGDSSMDEDVVERFGERCKDALRKQFNGKKREFTLRMSAIGRPLCQQQMEKEGAKPEPLKPSLKLKFTYGDMIEALVMAVMEAAKVNIESFQEGVSHTTGSTTIKGTLDVIIDGKVYDIKSASQHAFKNKFSRSDGFAKIAEDDAFGYIAQGYLYSSAKDLPFGGWIAYNKETGDIAVCKAPASDAYKRSAIGKANKNIKALVDDVPFKRQFEKVKEKFRNKITGNYTIALNCRYCNFKTSCWGNEIVFRKNPRGASSKWYVGEPK